MGREKEKETEKRAAEEEQGGEAKKQKTEDAAADNNECFVRGLGYDVTEEQLVEFFKEVGECTARILKDRETGESRGMGFVTFETNEKATEAATWDGSQMGKRWINIRVAEKREEGKGKGKGKGDKGKGK